MRPGLLAMGPSTLASRMPSSLRFAGVASVGTKRVVQEDGGASSAVRQVPAWLPVGCFVILGVVKVEVTWKSSRLDEGDDPDPPMGAGMLEIEGRIRVDGEDAGLTDGFYLLADEPESSGAFFEFWDMEQWTCEIYEELKDPGGNGFRQPLPRLLELDFGILFIRLIALKPGFRGKGVGREVLARWTDKWFGEGVGAIVIDARPLQRRRGGFDEHGQEVTELPWESEAADTEQLAKHLRGWGFHRIAGTRFMVASPEWLGLKRSEPWLPEDDDDLPF